MATSNEGAQRGIGRASSRHRGRGPRAVRGAGALENLRAGHHQPHGRGALAVLPLLLTRRRHLGRLDDYVADFIEATHYWNAQRHPGDIESALSSVVKLMRLGVFEHERSAARWPRDENAALYRLREPRGRPRGPRTSWTPRCATYGALHEIRIEHAHETFYVLILGIVGYLRTHPDVDDEVLKGSHRPNAAYMDRGANGAPESG